MSDYNLDDFPELRASAFRPVLLSGVAFLVGVVALLLSYATPESCGMGIATILIPASILCGIITFVNYLAVAGMTYDIERRRGR